MPSLSHYDVLEVSPKASAEVIRAAYKSLMQRHHPDKNDNGAAATAQTTQLAQAYAVLGDAQRRRAYDESLDPLQVPAWHSAAARGPRASMRAQRVLNGYAPALILVILFAGGAILWLSPSKGSGSAAPQERRAASVKEMGADGASRASLAPASADGAGATVEMSSRTVAAFMTDLSIELAGSGPLAGNAAHVLQIPEFGLRVSARQPDRWLQVMQQQRPQFTQQLLLALSKANYLELVKSDGDLYLRKLMEESLLAALGPEQANLQALPATSVRAAPPVLQVLLPLSYSVR